MILVAAFLALQVQTQALERPPADVHPRRLLVKEGQGAQALRVDAALGSVGAVLVRDLPQIRWKVIEVPEGTLVQSKRRLERDGAFADVQFDHRRGLAYVPNDPFWPGMWHMTQIRADAAWDTEKGDASVRVAIMDTGLDYTHPDLAANVWTNPGEIPSNGIDDEGNGYIDDVHGYDFAYGDGEPNDVFGHGTSCAGIVAAVQDNAIGVTGVAPGCELVGVKAAIDSGFFFDSANVPALVYIADMDFDVVSMSFYSDEVTPAERDAIDYCWANGVLPVAAAGNDFSVLPYYPAAYDHVLSVGATNGSDQRSYFSNAGSWVRVAAPGESLSTVTLFGGYTTGFAGTSGACPHVAGLAALLFSADPSATNADVRAAIEDGALLLDQAPYGIWTNYGRVDARSALDILLGTTTPTRRNALAFAAPCGGSLGLLGTPAANPVLASSFANAPELHGVFDPDAILEVRRNGISQSVSAIERNRVAYGLASNLPGTIELLADGAAVESFQWQSGPGFVYAPSDAGTKGSGTPAVSGGWAEMVGDDASVLTCTARSDGYVYLELAIRKVLAQGWDELSLEVTRGYDNCTGGTETIELYDWSTWSYPYGSFVSISSRGITGSATESFTITPAGDPTRFLDDSGTAYLRITTTNAAANGALRLDGFRLLVN